MRFGVECNKGMVRESNEDSCNIVAGYPDVPVSFIIADGMGGHNSGEVASKMAVDLASRHIMEISGGFPDEEAEAADELLLTVIDGIMQRVNTEVFQAARENEIHHGMGTTLILAVVHQHKLYIGHIGDSRVYLVRDRQMERLTVDHSYVEELVRNGSLTREEAENHPKKNLITRVLGCSESILADKYICEIRDHDIFMLCTDGLTNMLTENEIKAILVEEDNPQHVCSRLVSLANEKGGEDNITVIVFNAE
jgi:PPM family protein phosphatase